MKCPACHCENVANTRFCGECGSGMKAAPTAPSASTTACIQCGHLFPSAQKFCGECGGKRPGTRAQSADLVEPISAESALSELKIVTVLFSDMCGFTSLSERLEVEELRDLMNGWFDRVSTLIPSFGGTIDKFIGDAVMALFGARIAHENDPKRAIDAALAMQAELADYNREVAHKLGQAMQIRIGINTGRVYAGMLGGDAHQSYTVMGDAVNVASRLESSCPVGSILVSESTLEHVRGVYEIREQQPLRVKGKSEPLTTFEVLGRRRPSERTESNENEIVALSRGEELENVIQLFDDVRISARPQLVAVLGDPGMAKNQFSSCLAHRLKARHLAASLSTHCDAGLASAPFQVLADWLGQAAAGHTDFEAYLRASSLPVEEMRLLAHLMQLSSRFFGPPAALGDPSALHHAIMAAALQWLRNLARHGPVLLRIHNLQHAPDATLDLLTHLLDCENLPLIIVITASTKVAREESYWIPLMAHAAKLTLEALDEATSKKVAAHMLSPMEPSSPNLIEAVAEASGGNPGFMEESIRALLAQGILIETDKWMLKDNSIPTPLPIPDTVGRMIQVRVDGLSPRSKLILQHATIAGARFDAHLLAALEDVEDALNAEEIEEILREPVLAGLLSASRMGHGLPTEYRFRPAMVRDEIYETVVAKQRREWHGRYAKFLREESMERSTMRVASMEAVAAHVLRAGSYLEAARLYRKAGDAAASVYANSDARRQYESADAALQRGAAGASDRAEVLQLLGRMSALNGDHERAQEAFTTAVQLLGETCELERAKIKVEHGRSLAAAGNRKDARACYSHAIDLTRESADALSRTALADAQQNLGWLEYLDGKLDRAQSLFEAALSAPENAASTLVWARCYDSLGTLARTKGDTNTAIQHMKRSLALRREGGDRPGVASSFLNLGAVYFASGDYAQARLAFNESLKLHTRRGNIDGIANILLNIGATELELEQNNEATEHLREATALANKHGLWYLPECLRYQAEAAHAAENYDQARLWAKQGLEQLGEDGPIEFRGNLHSVLGIIELSSNELGLAVSHLDTAAELHKASQNNHELAVTFTRQSKVAAASGGSEDARELLSAAKALFAEASNHTWVERCEHALSKLV